MEQDTNGGTDVGRDDARELGDEPPATIRDSAPDYLAPIDDSSPVSGHQPVPESTTSPADAPEQDWSLRVTCSTRRSARSGRRD